MKKYILSALFLGSIYLAASQEPARRFGFGLQAGWSSSHISGDTYDSKSGFIGGVHATVPVFGNFSVQPEANYQKLGGKYKQDSFAVGDVRYRYVELDVSYLNVPVLIKYRIASTNLSINAGPQIGFRLNAKDRVDDGNYFGANSVKSTDLSGIYGLEYFVKVPDDNVAFVLNARYMTGFTNFAKYSYSNMPEDSYKNNAFMVTLGLRF